MGGLVASWQPVILSLSAATMNDLGSVKHFFAGFPYAVVGASRNRLKYGNKVLRAYLQAGRIVYPVNPAVDKVESITAYPDLVRLPEPVRAVSVVTPPPVTEEVVQQAGELGIRNIWLQPGSENQEAVAKAVDFEMNVIFGGPCVLVALGYRE